MTDIPQPGNSAIPPAANCEPQPIFESESLSPEAREYAQCCLNQVEDLLAIRSQEYSPGIPVDVLSDLRVKLLSIGAYHVWREQLPTHHESPATIVEGIYAPPHRVFLGLSISTLDTPETDRSPEIENVISFFSKNFNWGRSATELKVGVLWPLLEHYAGGGEVELEPAVRAKVLRATSAIPHLSKDVNRKLIESGFDPKEPLGRLIWLQYQELMELIKEEILRHHSLSAGPEDIEDFREDLAAVTRFRKDEQS